jgi:hypothetical protein
MKFLFGFLAEHTHIQTSTIEMCMYNDHRSLLSIVVNFLLNGHQCGKFRKAISLCVCAICCESDCCKIHENFPGKLFLERKSFEIFAIPCFHFMCVCMYFVPMCLCQDLPVVAESEKQTMFCWFEKFSQFCYYLFTASIRQLRGLRKQLGFSKEGKKPFIAC